MSDSSSKAKLAAAKKRFKELKEQKEGVNGSKKSTKKTENPNGSNESDIQHIPSSISESIVENLQPELNNTFRGNTYFSEVPIMNANAFFDVIPAENNTFINFESSVIPNVVNPPLFQQNNHEETEDSVTLDDPELHEIFDKANMITNEDAKKLEEYLHHDSESSKSVDIDVTVYQNKISELENFNAQLHHSLQPLQEQLEYHRKTLQILVDEKTELIAQLNEAQGSTRQKVSENEDLQGRLRASRSRVADLEKEINCLKSLKNDFEKNGIDRLKEYDSLVVEYKRLKECSEESQQVQSELQEKLNVQIATNQNLERDLQNSNNLLEKLQIRLQQLSLGNEVATLSDSAKEQHLEKQIADLQEALNKANSENDQASKQYQQYVEQLNMQRQSMAHRIETLTADNTELGNREQNLIKHISDLEKLLQENTGERVSVAPEGTAELETKLKEVQESLESITIERNKLEELYKESETEKLGLEQNLQEAQEKITELQKAFDRHKADQPNMVELLATMESDKVAAARAVTQNNELKKQLEELQEAFVRINNNKLELTEKLEAEQHYNKEVHVKWKEKNAEVELLRQQIEELQENSVDVNKQILVQNQLTDRLRHYEAQGHMSEALQKELQEYKNMFETLKFENQHLKELTDNACSPEELQERDKQIEALRTEKDTLEEELSAMKQKTLADNIPEDVQKQLQILRDLADSNKLNFENLLTEYMDLQSIKNKYEALKKKNQQTAASQAPYNNATDNYLDKEKAMEQLEQRFTKIMGEVANLTDEKQKLEHLVMQLQGETETIGEYIALYQHQRAILKEKTSEKDEQLKRLAADREEVKKKLEDLNTLIQDLFKGDKIQIPNEVLEKHQHLNSSSQAQACSEHSHLQEQISVGAEKERNHENNNDNNNGKIQTADKIMALLSEIKSSNLVQPHDGTENFHPCPWCSGQLITV